MSVTFDNLDFDDGELNGECFIAGSQGELEAIRPECQVHFPVTNTGAIAAIPDFATADKKTLSVYAKRFLMANFCVLRNFGKPEITNLSDADAMKVSFLRYLAVQNGYLKPFDQPAAHNVKYSDCVADKRRTDWTSDEKSAFLSQWTALKSWRAKHRLFFIDMVCVVAFLFRTRGHHYQDSFRERFSAVWVKTLHEPIEMDWLHVARHSLHAIYPDDLDNAWYEAIANQWCSGTMSKRWNCAAAGTAGILALNVAVNDLMVAAPGIGPRLSGGITYLSEQLNLVKADRWKGSVNGRFYGASPMTVDEGKLGHLAAACIGSLQAFAPSSDMLQSLALRRIAGNAPITGGVISATIEAATKTESAIEGLLTQETFE